MRRHLAQAVLAFVAALALGACGSSSSSSSQAGDTTSTGTTTTTTTSGTKLGFEGIPLEQGAEIGPASSTTQGGTVAGIQCGATEQLVYHIHAHLAVYANGQPRSLPPGIGIPGAILQQTQYGPVVGQGKCFYWLHTHTADGVIHIESPTRRIYALGNVFDEWRQPLTATQVGTLKGKVTAFVDGKPWTGNLRDIPLKPHTVIQLDVGTATPPFQPVSFSSTQL
jgi:hypothetical protein